MRANIIYRRHPFLIILALILLFAQFDASCSSAKTKTRREKAKVETEKADDETTAENDDSENAPEANEPKAAPRNTKGKPAANSHAKPVSDPHSSKQPEFAAIWADLIAGNKRFMAGKHTSINYAAARESLVKEQHPKTVILGCSDSRVPPEMLFDKNLGDLFVVRDAGNIADRLTLGSIEYAIQHLGVKVLVILGHESCGAVAATISGEPMPSPNLQLIIDNIAPSLENEPLCKKGSEPDITCIKLNVDRSAKDVLNRSTIIKKAVENGELQIVHAVYKMRSGEVIRID